MKLKKFIAAAAAAAMIASGTGCSLQNQTDSPAEYLAKEDIAVNETFTDDTDGGHVIEVSGEECEYSNAGITKTGEASGDEADFYGENSAVFAAEKGTLTIRDSLIETNGTHANAVFSYGEGTTVSVSDTVIETQGNCSGGIMTTGGGTMNAANLTINTSGNSSAAIRSDRGGGTVTVTRGSYRTSGTGSPVIYSTADITVNDAYMESTASQGVVVEGKNSVTLNGTELIADNNTKNSDKSDYYQAVMIYQSMSGDAAEGTSSFTATDSSITNKNGDIFFINNTATEINLTGTDITNEDPDGLFLRAAAAGWGKEGSNGGQVKLNASSQAINGDITVDNVSMLDLYLKDASSLKGAINTEGQSGKVYVEIEEGSSWVLTDDSYISSLTVNEGSAIDLNGHKLYVDGKEYTGGSVSEGTAFDFETTGGGAPDGMQGEPPEMPDGEPPAKPDGEPPAKPDGEPPAKPDGEPPAKPDGEPPAKPGN